MSKITISGTIEQLTSIYKCEPEIKAVEVAIIETYKRDFGVSISLDSFEFSATPLFEGLVEWNYCFNRN